MMKLRQLEIRLQKVRGFTTPSPSLEQYMTPPSLAARLLFHAALNGEITDCRVCDLGCGTGMLAIGAALLGAEVTAVDCDSKALSVARLNAEDFGVEILFFERRVDSTTAETFDTVVMNPPFGAQVEHADRPFIDESLHVAPVCYGIFNTGTIPFLTAYIHGRGVITDKISGKLEIPRQFSFHTKDFCEIPVEIVRYQRYT